MYLYIWHIVTYTPQRRDKKRPSLPVLLEFYLASLDLAHFHNLSLGLRRRERARERQNKQNKNLKLLQRQQRNRERERQKERSDKKSERETLCSVDFHLLRSRFQGSDEET